MTVIVIVIMMMTIKRCSEPSYFRFILYLFKISYILYFVSLSWKPCFGNGFVYLGTGSGDGLFLPMSRSEEMSLFVNVTGFSACRINLCNNYFSGFQCILRSGSSPITNTCRPIASYFRWKVIDLRLLPRDSE